MNADDPDVFFLKNQLEPVCCLSAAELHDFNCPYSVSMIIIYPD